MNLALLIVTHAPDDTERHAIEWVGVLAAGLAVLFIAIAVGWYFYTEKQRWQAGKNLRQHERSSNLDVGGRGAEGGPTDDTAPIPIPTYADAHDD